MAVLVTQEGTDALKDAMLASLREDEAPGDAQQMTCAQEQLAGLEASYRYHITIHNVIEHI